MENSFDLLVIGSGPAGLIASIIAAQDGKSVAILEKLPKPSLKLKSTGGGRCNLTNTLSNEEFLKLLGKEGRFFQEALKAFNKDNLINFLNDLGLEVSIADGFRVFPSSHNSQSVLDVFFTAIQNLDIKLFLNEEVEEFLQSENQIAGVATQNNKFKAKNIVVATGGCGYSSLGGSLGNYDFLKKSGHTITALYPAMLPLHTKETWVANCTADTIPKAIVKIDIKKYSKSMVQGDLIFTKKGFRGPVILDFASSITPLFEKYDEIPVKISLCAGKNEDEIFKLLKNDFVNDSSKNILENLQKLIPASVAKEILHLCTISESEKFNKIEGYKKINFYKL